MCRSLYISKETSELEGLIVQTSDGWILRNIHTELTYRAQSIFVRDLRERIVKKLSENEAEETKAHEETVAKLDSSHQEIRAPSTKAETKGLPHSNRY